MKLKTEELKHRHDSAFLCRRETGEEQEEAMKLRMDSAIMDDQKSSGGSIEDRLIVSMALSLLSLTDSSLLYMIRKKLIKHSSELLQNKAQLAKPQLLVLCPGECSSIYSSWDGERGGRFLLEQEKKLGRLN
ncbi:hypothetical protein SLA2020_456130 [Shorea laevis]